MSCRCPKLYEYLGIIVLFYSNEHEPIHVHGKRQGRETKAELVVENGRVIEIVYSAGEGPIILGQARPEELSDADRTLRR
jgi:hypothetical protein